MWQVLLAAITMSMLVGSSAHAEGWEVTRRFDEFTDEPVVSARVTNDRGDDLLVVCDDEENLISIYAPRRQILGEEFAVRYRVDKNPVVSSEMAWRNANGRAETSFVTKRSLFGDGPQEGQNAEFLNLLSAIMEGSTFVIEAGEERAKFLLRGSRDAISEAMTACGVSFASEPQS
ncbi:MAG: hypothetical protein ACE5Q3_05885 [Alphaproteobacteria bacterium]